MMRTSGVLCFDGVLSLQLALLGSFSVLYSQLTSGITSYPYLSSDHAGILSLFIHHMWIGASINVGSFTHLAIGICCVEALRLLLLDLMQHRDMLIGHSV